MSTTDRHEPNSEGSEPQQLGASEDTPLAEGTRSFAPQRSLTLAPPSVERRLVELFASIGHEFRIPLTVINGYTATLLRRGQQLSLQEHDEFLQIIQQAGLRLEDLLIRLFEIAELDAGNASLQWSHVDIPTVVRECIALVKRHVPEPLQDHFTFHMQ